jgi:hypothetical protein
MPPRVMIGRAPERVKDTVAPVLIGIRHREL